MKKTIIIAVAAILLTACSFDNTGAGSSETMPVLATVSTVEQVQDAMQPVTLPQETTAVPEETTQSAPEETLRHFSDEELETLDSECKGYGQGLQVDDMNRPIGAIAIQQELEDYGFIALSDSDTDICLTFDQGYENGYTEKILDTLKDKQVKAVFFLTGDYVRRNEELVRRMIDEGHVLGNHGWAHASIPKLSDEEAIAEITQLNDYVYEKFGYQMKYFRPPCGEYSQRACAIAQNLGYRTTLWSFAYADWDINNQPDVNTAYDRVSGAAHGGGIFLLHSVSSTNAEILPEVIDSFREQGYTLTPLPM